MKQSLAADLCRCTFTTNHGGIMRYLLAILSIAFLAGCGAPTERETVTRAQIEADWGHPISRSQNPDGTETDVYPPRIGSLFSKRKIVTYKNDVAVEER